MLNDFTQRRKENLASIDFAPLREKKSYRLTHFISFDKLSISF
jgi:hypothetical protein